MEIIILLLVLLIVLVEDCAMSCIRVSMEGKYQYFIYGMLFYLLVAVLLKQSFSMRGMAAVNTLWNALSVITVAGIGYFYFGEKLTKWEIVAVGLATVAATIMSR